MPSAIRSGEHRRGVDADGLAGVVVGHRDRLEAVLAVGLNDGVLGQHLDVVRPGDLVDQVLRHAL
ncbi:MAG: hypothetical protein DCC51_05975 [Anaerolineae bacterium]|nr:MAG: hypothetical protein DCC51_05975 [Anaerolineae bacterium]